MTELWADHLIRQGRERILFARYRKGDKKADKQETSKARQGEAGLCRTEGGRRGGGFGGAGGAGGAGTGGTGAGTMQGQYVAWGGKERHRGENRSLYIQNPPLPRFQSKVLAHSGFRDRVRGRGSGSGAGLANATSRDLAFGS